MQKNLDNAQLLLTELQRVFEVEEEDSYAATLRKVLRGNQAELYAFLTSGDFWGGMGSIIDCAFCTPSELGKETDTNNRRAFLRLVIRLGEQQLESEICTAEIQPQIERWIKVFKAWLEANLI